MRWERATPVALRECESDMKSATGVARSQRMIVKAGFAPMSGVPPAEHHSRVNDSPGQSIVGAQAPLEQVPRTLSLPAAAAPASRVVVT